MYFGDNERSCHLWEQLRLLGGLQKAKESDRSILVCFSACCLRPHGSDLLLSVLHSGLS